MSTRKTLKKNGYKNKGKYFLPLMIGVNITCDQYLIDVNFIQLGFPQVVYIFHNSDDEPLKMEIHKMSQSPYFISAEFGDDNKEVALFFDIPVDQRDNFQNFVAGKYSKFDEKLKEKVVRKYGMYREKGINKENGLPRVSPYDVIAPSPALKKRFKDALNIDVEIDEVLDAPKLEEEEYKEIEDLIKIKNKLYEAKNTD